MKESVFKKNYIVFQGVVNLTPVTSPVNQVPLAYWSTEVSTSRPYFRLGQQPGSYPVFMCGFGDYIEKEW